MANKVLKDYQGQSIKIDGVCYNYIGETTSAVDTQPNELGGTFESCLECALESSSSSFMYSESSSSESSEGYSESSSSEPAGGPAYAGTNPAINITLTGGGGYPRTFLGATFNSSGETISIEPQGYNSSAFYERWDRRSPTTATPNLVPRTLEVLANSSTRFVRIRARGASSDVGTDAYFGYFFGSAVASVNDGTANIDQAYVSGFSSGVIYITDKQFGLGLGGGAYTPNAGPFSGVTIKWQRGPDGSVEAWKAP